MHGGRFDHDLVQCQIALRRQPIPQPVGAIPNFLKPDSREDFRRAKSLDPWRQVWKDVAMGAAIGLRADFDGATLRRLARKTKNANQSRRLLALVF